MTRPNINQLITQAIRTESAWNDLRTQAATARAYRQPDAADLTERELLAEKRLLEIENQIRRCLESQSAQARRVVLRNAPPTSSQGFH